MAVPRFSLSRMAFRVHWNRAAVRFGILAAILTPGGIVHADWPADGVLLCSACRARSPLIASDGAGGAFVAWTDGRNGIGSNDDIFLQRVTPSGAIVAGWPIDGVPVCTAPRAQNKGDVHSMTPDGFGGVIIAWQDSRDQVPGGTGSDIYAQRVLADGSLAPGWPQDGAAVTRAPGDQEFPAVLADGSGGAFITWDAPFEPDPNIHLQHLAADGSVMPGWPIQGLPVCAAGGFQASPRLAPDGSGGVFVAWGDLRDGQVAAYAQRVTGGAEMAPGWPVNGRQIVATRYLAALVPDGLGGAYLAAGTPAPLYAADYYLQRITGSGGHSVGWPPEGAPICVAPNERVGLRMEPDGTGGVLLVWSDYRDGVDSDVYALRMRADGTRDPNWPVNGLPVTDNTLADDEVDLAPDGQGGVYLCWVQSLFAPRVMIQHLTASGAVAPGWPAGGRAIPGQFGSPRPHIVADGLGGAIVTWEDANEKARALRLAPDGPVAVQVSLVSAEAEPDRVRLTWYAGDAVSLLATVERRTEQHDWAPLGAVTADGNGRLGYEDRTVTPGTRYAYRLAYRDEGGERRTPETWVTVPAPWFALHGPEPNPVLGELVVAFSLASLEPARLEVFDLTGRQVLAREVGAPGIGTHRVRLVPAGRLPAGVFTVRLTQGERRATARVVVLR